MYDQPNSFEFTSLINFECRTVHPYSSCVAFEKLKLELNFIHRKKMKNIQFSKQKNKRKFQEKSCFLGDKTSFGKQTPWKTALLSKHKHMQVSVDDVENHLVLHLKHPVEQSP